MISTWTPSNPCVRQRDGSAEITDGYRTRQVEVRDTGEAVRIGLDDFPINPPIDLQDPDLADQEITAEEFERYGIVPFLRPRTGTADLATRPDRIHDPGRTRLPEPTGAPTAAPRWCRDTGDRVQGWRTRSPH
ncbi:hypothetical protein [Nocardia sp. NPDC051750]|uniref:hypothetical protein n=1 Tax=Nocardia sp. NPDC051750 TaxID=3364325 RepID=UPI0037B28D5C